MQGGMNDYLPKPYEREGLLAALNCVGQPRLSAPDAATSQSTLKSIYNENDNPLCAQENILQTNCDETQRYILSEIPQIRRCLCVQCLSREDSA